MSKNKKDLSPILLAVLILLGVGIIGLYLYEVLVAKKPPTENLLKFILTLGTLIISAIRLLSFTPKTSVIENAYAKYTEDAFSDSKKAYNLYISALCDL